MGRGMEVRGGEVEGRQRCLMPADCPKFTLLHSTDAACCAA